MGTLAHFNALPIVLFAGFFILLMALLVVGSLTLRYAVSSEGIAFTQRSILLYRKYRLFCGWNHVCRIYTYRSADGLVPAPMIIDGGRVIPNLEQFSNLEAAMAVIKGYAPGSIICSWDLPVERNVSTDRPEAQPVDETPAAGEQIVLQSTGATEIAANLVGSLIVLTGFVWLAVYLMTPALPLAFPIYDKWLTTLIILSCVFLLAFLLPVPISLLIRVGRDCRRLGMRCIVDENGLTFMNGNRRRPWVVEHIPWDQVQQVFTYKTLSDVIPAEILLRDGRCLHLHRLFPSSHLATDLVLSHLLPDAVKDWPFSCNPPGYRGSRKESR